jgi:DNA gyrase subunit A
MRIVLETTRTVEPEELLRSLYRLTPLEATFSIIMLALVNGEPRILTLKQALRHYIEHRLEVVRRRSEYDLEKARQRAHILEGLLVALKNLDDVIDTIRRSRTVETARTNLMKKFDLTEIQAQAILDMPLRRLAAIERSRLQEEYKGIRAQIRELETLLASPLKMRMTVKQELLGVKEQYADVRRTLIVDKSKRAVLTSADLIQDEQVWIIVGEDGTLARTQNAGMFDIPGRPQEHPSHLQVANTRDIVYLVAANGEAINRRVYDLPLAVRMGEGVHWTEGTQFARGAYLAGFVTLPEEVIGQEQTGYLFMATLAGTVKRVRVVDLPGLTDQPFTLIRVDDGDALGWICWTSGNNEVLLATASGQVIRFHEDDVRPMGLPAGGVAGIKLKSDADGVVGMETVTEAQVKDKKQVALVWSITDNGLAKASALDAYPTQKRYGQGVVNVKLPKDAEEVVAMTVGDKNTEIYVKTQRSVKLLKIGRATIGSRSIKPVMLSGISVTPPNRVTGVVKGMEAVEEINEKARQLSLL